MNPFLIVSIVTLFLVFFIDWYVYQGLKTAVKNLKSSLQKFFIGAHWFFFAATIITIITALIINHYYWPKLFRSFWLPLVFISYLSKVFVILFILADDVRRTVKFIIYKLKGPTTEIGNGPRISRAKFLSQAGIIAGTIPFGVSIYGMSANAYNYQYRKIPLYIKNLPKAFIGKKIVQISDIHTGSLSFKNPVWEVVKNINKENPDLIFFTGDLVNDRSEELLEYKDILAHLKADTGIFSVLGNHDYGDYLPWPSQEEKEKNFNQLLTHQKEMGWDMLNNDHFIWSRKGSKAGIIGVENWSNKMRFPRYGDMEKAIKGMPLTDTNLLLSHDPSHWDYEILKKHKNIDVTFSGHTHGFQFGIETENWKWSPVQFVYKRWAGLYQEGHNQLYVNRGLGFIGYPGRIGILPEVSIFTLHSA
ncbi:MAG: metallophosphoesterase [Chitinophagaceae bacterium]|nr:MAG: metallophosphoesterase [Chitinophagaceae bacterium]